MKTQFHSGIIEKILSEVCRSYTKYNRNNCWRETLQYQRFHGLNSLPRKQGLSYSRGKKEKNRLAPVLLFFSLPGTSRTLKTCCFASSFLSQLRCLLRPVGLDVRGILTLILFDYYTLLPFVVSKQALGIVTDNQNFLRGIPLLMVL